MRLKLDRDIDWHDLPKIESPFFATSLVEYGDPCGGRISGLDDVIKNIGGPLASVSDVKRYLPRIIDGLEDGNIYLLKQFPSSPVFKWIQKDRDNGYWEIAESHGLSFNMSAEYMLRNVVRQHHYFLQQRRKGQGDVVKEPDVLVIPAQSSQPVQEEKPIDVVTLTKSDPEIGEIVAPPSILKFIEGKKPGVVYDWGKGEFTQNAELYAQDLTSEEIAYLDQFNLKPIDPNNLTEKQAKRASELFGSHPNKNILYANWRTRARILNNYKFRHPATQAGLMHYFRFTRDLNPVGFSFERGYQIASGEEMFTGEPVSRAGAGVEMLLAIALLKGMGKLSRLGADDGIDELTTAERSMVDDVARQLTNDIKQSQAAMGRAVEAKSTLPGTKANKTKVVASDGYTTMSGWDAKTTKAPKGYSRVTPEEVKAYSDNIGHNVKKHRNDIHPFTKEGWEGLYNSSHAEKQMSLLSPNEPIGVSKEMCSDCINYFKKQAQYTGKPQIVTDPEMTRIFMPDGVTVKEIPLN